MSAWLRAALVFLQLARVWGGGVLQLNGDSSHIRFHDGATLRATCTGRTPSVAFMRAETGGEMPADGYDENITMVAYMRNVAQSCATVSPNEPCASLMDTEPPRWYCRWIAGTGNSTTKGPLRAHVVIETSEPTGIVLGSRAALSCALPTLNELLQLHGLSSTAETLKLADAVASLQLQVCAASTSTSDSDARRGAFSASTHAHLFACPLVPRAPGLLLRAAQCDELLRDGRRPCAVARAL